MTPNQMPKTGTPVIQLKRERVHTNRSGCCASCDEYFTYEEQVPALKGSQRRKRRPPVPIRNTALADALRAAGRL